MVGILLSYWGGLFSGAMLVSGRVTKTMLPLPGHETRWDLIDLPFQSIAKVDGMCSFLVLVTVWGRKTPKPRQEINTNVGWICTYRINLHMWHILYTNCVLICNQSLPVSQKKRWNEPFGLILGQANEERFYLPHKTKKLVGWIFATRDGSLPLGMDLCH